MRIQLIAQWMTLPVGHVLDVTRGEGELLVARSVAREAADAPAPAQRAAAVTPVTKDVPGPQETQSGRRFPLRR